MNIFNNLKVIELSSVLAGPLVGTFFAELGAEVLKVENSKTGGDVTRSWKLSGENPEQSLSAYYASANYGKTSILRNLSDDSDHREILSLIKKADVVLVNFKPGDALRLELDFESLLQVNPSLVYGEIVGFSENDPRVAYDVVLQAETGYMSMNGEPDSPPLKMPLAMIDILTAHQLKEGILCALLQRSVDGKGRKVTVSLYDSAIASLTNQASNWLMNKQIPQRTGSLHPNIAPYGETFQCKDGEWIVLAIGSDQQFYRLCGILKMQELKSDLRFITNAGRVKHRSELAIKFKEQFLKKPIAEWAGMMLEQHIPFGQIKDLQAVFEEDQAKKLILEQEMEGIITKRVRTVAFNITGD
ncbi:CaiB/BaiF CoA transferase family protein [Cecembia calidifontis]|jgi:crotonobetainyl-CoA:carnitine CoA-transferase CaiB-like acyl-CoA transferase|nr:CoA transferase [Cecembia calidifontis]